eukprot:COSAG06_NODE_9526_length_1879_cov_1.769663_3_plen_325_part_00
MTDVMTEIAKVVAVALFLWGVALLLYFLCWKDGATKKVHPYAPGDEKLPCVDAIPLLSSDGPGPGQLPGTIGAVAETGRGGSKFSKGAAAHLPGRVTQQAGATDLLHDIDSGITYKLVERSNNGDCFYASVDGMTDMVTGSVRWPAIGSQQELEKAHHTRQRVVAFMREHDEQICSYTGCSHEEIAMGAGAVDASGNGDWELFLGLAAQSAQAAAVGGMGGSYADEMILRSCATMLQADLSIYEREQTSNSLHLYRTIEPMWRVETDDDKARTFYKQLCEEELASGKLSDTERASIELELEEVIVAALNFGKRALLYSNGNHCE